MIVVLLAMAKRSKDWLALFSFSHFWWFYRMYLYSHTITLNMVSSIPDTFFYKEIPIQKDHSFCKQRFIYLRCLRKKWSYHMLLSLSFFILQSNVPWQYLHVLVSAAPVPDRHSTIVKRTMTVFFLFSRLLLLPFTWLRFFIVSPLFHPAFFLHFKYFSAISKSLPSYDTDASPSTDHWYSSCALRRASLCVRTLTWAVAKEDCCVI